MLQIVLHQETSQCKTDNQWSLHVHVFYELLIQIYGLAKENYKINKLNIYEYSNRIHNDLLFQAINCKTIIDYMHV